MNPSLRLTAFVFLILLCLLGAGGVDAADATVVRGEYLTRAADCEACHTRPGGVPFAGGLPFRTPMGTLYSPNLTPDEKTGLGRYSAETFRRALHQGIGHDGRHLYPAFPYEYYTLLTNDDVEAIRRYLMSLEPVAADIPANDMSFPFDQRWGIALWNWLYFEPRRFEADANASDEINRGAYLVEALGHCGACHTPRSWTLGRKQDEKFMGATIEGWHAYNITNDPMRGIGAWSNEQIAAYLGQGNVPRLAQAGGPMADVIAHSGRYLTEGDRLAMAAYLKTIAPGDIQSNSGDGKVLRRSQRGHPASVAQLRATPFDIHDSSGQRLYLGNCATCHNWNGAGAGQGTYPALFHNSTVGAGTPTNLIQVILHGVHRQGGEDMAYMPGFGQQLNDAEIARLVNYLTATFGDPALQVDAAQVAALRAAAGTGASDH